MYASTNVLGTPLQPCSHRPLTGWFRDGSCSTEREDRGSHTVAAQVTMPFLEHLRSRGNDLITPAPEFGFPGGIGNIRHPESYPNPQPTATPRPPDLAQARSAPRAAFRKPRLSPTAPAPYTPLRSRRAPVPRFRFSPRSLPLPEARAPTSRATRARSASPAAGPLRAGP